MEEQLKELITAGSEERVNELLKFCESVKVIKIQTDDQYVQADKALGQIKKAITIIENERKATKEPHLTTCTLIDNWYNSKKAILEGMKNKLSPSLTEYDDEKRRKEAEENRRLKAIEETKRREIEAAAQRERDKADALRKEAEELAKSDRAAADALLVRAANADGRADLKEQKAFEVQAPVFTASTPKINSHLVDNWKMVITDMSQFVEHCAKNNLLYLLEVNEKAAKNYAKIIMKETEYPGAKIVNERIRASNRNVPISSLI